MKPIERPVLVGYARDEARVWCVEVNVPGLPVLLVTAEIADQLGVALLDASTEVRLMNDPCLGDRLDEARDEIRRSTR